MREAEVELETTGRPTTKGAFSFRDGLIIAVLTIAPKRRENLASLTLDRHLLRAGRNWSILLCADETKGKEELEYPLSEKVSRALDLYLEVFRPAIYGSNKHGGLWASAKGVQATGNALNDAVCRRTRNEFGVSMNLHLFRDSAFSFLAFYAPDHVRAGRDLLGHRHLHTGEKFYACAQTVLASRLVAQIEEARHLDQPIADLNTCSGCPICAHPCQLRAALTFPKADVIQVVATFRVPALDDMAKSSALPWTGRYGGPR